MPFWEPVTPALKTPGRCIRIYATLNRVHWPSHSGMARVNVETGQTLAAGEPVGEMGETPAQGNMIGGQLKDARPIIYVEFRKAGSAVDSTAWWIGGRKEARNQKGMN